MRTAVVIALAALAACEGSEAADERSAFELTFTATTDRGEPLGGVSVELGGQPVGATNEHGALSVSISVADGTSSALVARCPDGYRDADTVAHLMFRRHQALGTRSTTSSLEVSITCPRELMVAALVVRAPDRAGLPVVVNGERRAVTDASGVAHLSFEIEPDSALRVALDTGRHPQLRPQDPEAVFTIRNSDEIFVFDQKFDVKEKTRRRRRRRQAAPAATPAPAQPVRNRRPIRIR